MVIHIHLQAPLFTTLHIIISITTSIPGPNNIALLPGLDHLFVILITCTCGIFIRGGWILGFFPCVFLLIQAPIANTIGLRFRIYITTISAKSKLHFPTKKRSHQTDGELEVLMQFKIRVGEYYLCWDRNWQILHLTSWEDRPKSPHMQHSIWSWSSCLWLAAWEEVGAGEGAGTGPLLLVVIIVAACGLIF